MKILISTIAILLSMGAQASSILVVDGAGQLTGATGVDVGGTLYDVEFRDGTCVGLFNGCDQASDFFFQSSSQSLEASNALIAQVFNNNVFEDDPEFTNGCEDIIHCLFLTPHGIHADGYILFSTGRNDFLEVRDVAFFNIIAVTRALNTYARPTVVWAVWTDASQVPVPEPSSLALLVLGLTGLTLTRKGSKA